METGSFDIDPPNESVKDWPLIGEQTYEAWSTASTNFDEFLETYHEQTAPVVGYYKESGAVLHDIDANHGADAVDEVIVEIVEKIKAG